MLGIPDVSVALAYVLTVLSTAACVVYGIANWNKDGEPDREEAELEARWMSEERVIEEEEL